MSGSLEAPSPFTYTSTWNAYILSEQVSLAS